MVTLTRKEREKVEREAKILHLAAKMLDEFGYLGLSMDRIAAEMDYSKGTIYQHFRNKEEIILALALEAQEKRLSMFQTASEQPGTPRERIASVGAAAEKFVERYPHFFAVEQIVRANSIWEKTSEERRQLMQTCERNCLQIVGGIVRDAIAHGDLQLPQGRSAEDIVFGVWAMSFGAYTIITSSESLSENGIQDPLAALRLGLNRLLDGHQWRPLSAEVDYSSIMDRVKHEVFKDE